MLYYKFSGRDLTRAAASCTGEQMAIILAVVTEAVGDLCWVAGDVEASGHIPICEWMPAEPIPESEILGNTLDFMSYCARVSQFDSGAFRGFKGRVPEPIPDDLWTEGPPTVDLAGAVLEITAFDNSWIGVVTEDYRIISAFGARLNASPMVLAKDGKW